MESRKQFLLFPPPPHLSLYLPPPPPCRLYMCVLGQGQGKGSYVLEAGLEVSYAALVTAFMSP